VKPEFRDGDSNFLDLEKVAAAGATDLHTFTVIEFKLVNTALNGALNKSGNTVEDPNQNVKVIESPILENANYKEFFAWYSSTVKKHLIETTTALENTTKVLESPYCDRCCCLAYRCGCKGYALQGGMASRMRESAVTKIADFTTDVVARVPANLYQKFADNFFPDVSKTADFIKDKISKFGLLGEWFYEQFKLFIGDACVQKLFLETFSRYAIDKLAIWSMAPSVAYCLDHAKKAAKTKNSVVHEPNDLYQKEQSYSEPSFKQWLSAMKERDRGVPIDIYRDAKDSSTPFTFSSETRNYTREQLINVIKKNQILINVDGSSVCATGIYRDVALTVAHIFKVFPCKATFTDGHQTFERVLTRDDIIHLDADADICVFRTSGRLYKDILRYFPQQTNFVRSLDNVDLVHFDPAMSLTNLFSSTTLLRVRSGDIAPQYSSDYYLEDGSCGALGVTSFAGGPPFIPFMHHMGHEKERYSLSVPLSIEWLGSSIEESRQRLHTDLTLDLANNGLRLTDNLPFKEGVFHHKAYAKWREFPEELKPLGSVDYNLMRPETNLEPTIFHGLIPESPKTIPDMTIGTVDGVYQNPFNNVLDELADKRATYPPREVRRALKKVVQRWKKIFKKFGRQYPLDEHHSLNGLDGVRFIDAVKKQTGQGLPLRGSKDKVIEGLDGERTYTPIARRSVRFVAACMANHVNPGVVADICLKDEPKKPSKAVRGFAALPFSYNDLMRRGLLPVFKIIQENPLLFGIAIGTDADSSSWSDIFDQHIARLFHILYDFTKYDRSHSAEILAAAHEVLFEAMSCIYDPSDLIEGLPWHQVIAGVFAFIANPLYNVQGTLYKAKGSLPSGAAHTAVVNSIIQEIILQMLWYRWEEERGLYEPEDEDSDRYKVQNSESKYGDDGMVSTDVEGFDLPFFAKNCAEWDLGITDPNKENPDQKTFPVEDWSFLKRNFVPYQHPTLGRIVEAPLELNSVLKSLNYWTPDKTQSESAAMAMRLNQAAHYLVTLRSEEATNLHILCKKILENKYGPDILKEVWSFEEIFAKRADRLLTKNRPPNRSNLAYMAGKDPAQFEADFYGKTFVLPER